jgi:hypothetical protein
MKTVSKNLLFLVLAVALLIFFISVNSRAQENRDYALKGSVEFDGNNLLIANDDYSILSNSSSLDSNDSSQLCRVELKNGSIYFGRILLMDSSRIVMETTIIPYIEIPVLQIKSAVVIDSSNFRNGVYWFPNPNPTRYLFGPSAINLKMGEGYYQNAYLLINSINYGLSNNFSLGFGFEFLTTMHGEPIYFISPKVGFQVDSFFHAGCGVLYLNLPDEMGNLGIVYGITTLGNKDKNITLGLGWGFVDGKFSQIPTVTISGMTRIFKNIAFVSENWLTPNYRIFSYGIRFFGENLAVDLAFLNNPEIAKNNFIGLPYVGFVVKF